MAIRPIHQKCRSWRTPLSGMTLIHNEWGKCPIRTTKKGVTISRNSLTVGVAGFEPTTPCSQSRCANRTALHPESFSLKAMQRYAFLFTYARLCNIFFNFSRQSSPFKGQKVCSPNSLPFSIFAGPSSTNRVSEGIRLASFIIKS